jgi:hypothetical protein
MGHIETLLAFFEYNYVSIVVQPMEAWLTNTLVGVVFD